MIRFGSATLMRLASGLVHPSHDLLKNANALLRADRFRPPLDWSMQMASPAEINSTRSPGRMPCRLAIALGTVSCSLLVTLAMSLL